jgi:hypothetical protein
MTNKLAGTEDSGVQHTPPAPPRLDARLREIASPEPLLLSASQFSDLPSWWRACHSPDWLIWMAARLCKTGDDRRAVIRCVTELAWRQGPRTDRRCIAAISAAEAWASGGEASAGLATAAAGAWEAAAEAKADSTTLAACARWRFASAPHHRLASAGTGRALAAHADWRAAERNRLAALAAAATVEAAWRADTAPDLPDQWAAWASYAVTAISSPPACGNRARTRYARCVRRRLACPVID